MSDLIDRQSAIDAIDVKNVNKGIISALQSIIEELPSAQLEEERMIELKACPFCGSKVELQTGVTPERYSKPMARIYCTKCKTVMGWFEDKNRDGMFIEEAVNAWNKRTSQTDEYEVYG